MTRYIKRRPRPAQVIDLATERLRRRGESPAQPEPTPVARDRTPLDEQTKAFDPWELGWHAVALAEYLEHEARRTTTGRWDIADLAEWADDLRHCWGFAEYMDDGEETDAVGPESVARSALEQLVHHGVLVHVPTRYFDYPEIQSSNHPSNQRSTR